MKRILGVLMLLLFITACDDGNLTVDAIDFSDVPVEKCPDKEVLYKIKDSEMLVLKIPASTFEANQTLDGAPIEVQLTSTINVTYRKYASTVSSLNVCGDLPSAIPNLVEEWTATDGIVQITATAIKTTDATTGFEKITGYLYYIIFKNITFNKPGGVQQSYDTFAFGNYTKTVSPLAFGFDEVVDKSTCTGDNRIFDFSGSEVFILDVANYNTLFASAVTTTPRTALISADNKLSYQLFSNVITNAYFCVSPPPATPTLLQEWKAVNGIAGTSGIIEVSTTTLGSSFLHTIRLKNVTLKKENSEFSLGNDYLFGTLTTN